MKIGPKTKEARERHEAGVMRLNGLFSYDPNRPSKPPPKHSRPDKNRLARKRARLSRKRNRS